MAAIQFRSYMTSSILSGIWKINCPEGVEPWDEESGMMNAISIWKQILQLQKLQLQKLQLQKLQLYKLQLQKLQLYKLQLQKLQLQINSVMII